MQKKRSFASVGIGHLVPTEHGSFLVQEAHDAESAAHLHRPAKPIFMENVLYSRRREPRLLAD
jgi:hypothetical protein